ncbi:hypothetical protein DL764_007689 [Monosporascus ibericus]|uniref:UBC core domain-containing protein n=1 Tax=Monosporascus ibericus TaxID=155417 RepID=A0A4Q4T2I8_9PEZI|nr:hypothetical protein DL764_007689 [Monosporascus ibericus]
MASSRLAGLPAVRKQHLLVEFAGLKQACPEGVFVSLTPGDASLWSGVLFVRDGKSSDFTTAVTNSYLYNAFSSGLEGPYAPATLRFQISFPDSYPLLPPLVTFSTDMFHPLISPLSTYMYATEVEDDGTVSATDLERLPPGGFSLRHGFPDWFGRGSSGTGGDRKSSGQQDVTQTPPRPINPSLSSGSSKPSAIGEYSGFGQTSRKKISTFEVLRYIRSTFDDENVLDSIPLSAAGNPGAWHAWRTHRMQNGKVFSDDPSSSDAEDTADTVTTGTKSSADSARRPGEWNWEGVWEERVKKAITASLSEPVLFGGAGPTDDVIRFLNMEENDIEAIKDNLLRTTGDVLGLGNPEARPPHTIPSLIWPSVPTLPSKTAYRRCDLRNYTGSSLSSFTGSACQQDVDTSLAGRHWERSPNTGLSELVSQLDGPAAYGSRQASSSTYSAHSSEDGTHDPYLLVPNISITPEARTLKDVQSSVWVAIEISGQLSKPSVPGDVHGMHGLNNFMPVHHGGGGLSRYGYIYDIKIDVLPTAHSSVTDIIDDGTRMICPGSSLLILAYVDVDASKAPQPSGKRKIAPDDLIADLELQLGSVKTEYIQVRLSYCHSGFPMLEDVSTASGISSRQSRLETTAVGVVNRHSTTSIWSPRPTPASNALFPIIASHWGPGRAHDVMNKIMSQRSSPRRFPKSNSRSMTNVRGSENSSPQIPVRTDEGAPVSVPQRKASLGKQQQQQSTPDDAMDPARKIWTEMRRKTSGRVTASLRVSKDRRLPPLSADLEPGPRVEMASLYSQAEVERRRQQIRDMALRNKRSIGADSLRSLVPSLVEFHLDSNGAPDDVIRGQETYSVGRKNEGRWNIGTWW